MTLLRIDASINPATSASRAIADIIEAEWLAAHQAAAEAGRALKVALPVVRVVRVVGVVRVASVAGRNP